MIQITDKTKCCGCTACANVCPVGAITMTPDEEGFLYPQVNNELCIECGLCEKRCPVMNRNVQNESVKGYIMRYNDPEVVEMSTSGGAFTAFALSVFEQDGIVYGAGYDEKMRVVCKRATCAEEITEMRGSKFVQSDLSNIFPQIKSDLSNGRKVLFTGTPCQVEGLMSYLGSMPDNLICVDFVCRGVPSPKLWENYVETMEEKYGSKIVGARFKHKTYGYHATTMKIDFANGKCYYGSGRVDPMMKAFVTELASRPSCGACAFKTVNRNSDITMFDCYEFTKLTGLPDDNKGYSSLLIHSGKGAELFENICSKAIVYNVDVKRLVEANGVMAVRSAVMNHNRALFYNHLIHNSIEQAMNYVSPIFPIDYTVERSKALFYRLGLIKFCKKLKNSVKEHNKHKR